MKTYDYRLILVASITCVVLIYCYPLLLPTPLLDPDEGLHATISQEMVETSDYVVPRHQGTPFLDKPILYFASQALSLKIFGMNEAAVRLPGLFFALLGVFTTALLARRLFDKATALLTALVALTLVVPLSLAQAAAHDVALVPWTNLLLLCWWEANNSSSSRKRLGYTVSSIFFVALALLTKGLIGIAVVSVGYVLYILLSRQLSVAMVTRYSVGLLFGGLLASPWFIAMEFNSPGYLWYYFIERHVGGFATEAQRHGGEPWHYYLPIVIGGAMPWIAYLVPGLWQARLDRQKGINAHTNSVLFALCWLLGGLLFLSVASSKLITYALPLFPAIAILVGHSLSRFINHDLSENVDTAISWLFRFSCVLGCVIPVAGMMVIDNHLGNNSSTIAYVCALITGAVAVVAILLINSGQRQAAVAVGASWFALFFFMMMTWPLQSVAEQYSQRSLGRQLAELDELPDKIMLADTRISSVIFYLTPEQRVILDPGQISVVGLGEIEGWSSIPPDTLLVITDRGLSKTHNPVIKQFAQADNKSAYRLVKQPLGLAAKQEDKTW